MAKVIQNFDADSSLGFLDMVVRAKMGTNLGAKAVGRVFNCGQGGGWRERSQSSSVSRGASLASRAHALISCVNPLKVAGGSREESGGCEQCRGKCRVAKHQRQRQQGHSVIFGIVQVDEGSFFVGLPLPGLC